MTAEDDVRYEEQLQKIQSKMPGRAGSALGWLRRPEMMPLRVTAAILLMAGGLAGFLPVLGFWMLPLGILLLAQDVPFLRRLSVRMFVFFERWGRKAAVALKRSWLSRRWRQLFR
ncbi:MAG: hypothetical protein U1E42_05425 [Rhodospirillales bacterium]